MLESDEQDKTRIQPRVPRAREEVTVFGQAPAVAAPPPATELITPPPPAVGRGPAPKPADVLKNRFVLEQVLGAGGMGVVYKAKDLLKVEAHDRDPYVAIKVLGEEFKSHPEAFIALQRESRKTQRIAHPNIVNVHDFDKDGDTVFMTMEYLEGTPLDKLIKRYRDTGVPRTDALHILDGICAALAYAHDQAIVHADLKPGNIFVTHLTTAKVFDFGIARAVAKAEAGEADGQDKTIFDAGNLGALTPAYASLEMLEGEPPDIRDDIYALGCIAYEMLTGRHPFKRKNAREALRAGMKPVRVPGLHKSQWRAIERALAFEREQRLATVHQFRAQLASAPAKTGARTLALLLLAAGAAGYYYYSEQIKPAPAPPVVLSEDAFRSQLEQKIRLEMIERNLAQLVAEPLFTPTWEAAVWDEASQLFQLVGRDASAAHKWANTLSGLYAGAVVAKIEAKAYAEASGLVDQGLRYGDAAGRLTALKSEIDAAQASRAESQQARQAQAETARRVEAERQSAARAAEQTRKEFDAALAGAEDLLACRQLVNFPALSAAVARMRELDASRYRAAEPALVRALAGCIEQHRPRQAAAAERLRDDAVGLFGAAAALTAIDFGPADNCHAGLAGLAGRSKRATCQDPLAAGGRGPTLVVVPSAASQSGFAIGRYEITTAEFNRYCRAASGCKPLNANDDLPATRVSFAAAEAYAKWLSAQTGRRYRLPTASEWRYAADAKGGSLANNRNCHLHSRGVTMGGVPVAASIGQSNGWGLVNAVGNAREWVVGGAALGGSFATPLDSCTTQSQTTPERGGDPETGLRVLREITN